MIRIVFFGEELSKEDREVYEIVKIVNLNVIVKVKDGVKFLEIDVVVRNYIDDKGYGKYFIYRIGYSVGLEIYDKGDVSFINYEEVKEGMIFLIELGIYFLGKIGVRIEDLVFVIKDGVEILNLVFKEVIIIK